MLNNKVRKNDETRICKPCRNVVIDEILRRNPAMRAVYAIKQNAQHINLNMIPTLTEDS